MSTSYDFKKYIDELNLNGCAVIPNFLDHDEIESILNEVPKLIDNFDFSSAARSVFETGENQRLQKDFLESVDKISPFFEKDAINEKGELVLPKHQSINKIGHCLHMKNEVFKGITFSNKVKTLIRQLGYKQPVVPQSMYIFKNGSKIGGPVVPHKDGSFLYTEPDLDLVGLWFPMVDVSLQNGCLSYVPKSHLIQKRQLFVRDEQSVTSAAGKFINTQDEQVYPESYFEPINVKKGGCVLIHGLVVHQSGYNETDQARPVYTFHLLDMHNKKWSDKNWLQETDTYKFPHLYDTEAN